MEAAAGEVATTITQMVWLSMLNGWMIGKGASACELLFKIHANANLASLRQLNRMADETKTFLFSHHDYLYFLIKTSRSALRRPIHRDGSIG